MSTESIVQAFVISLIDLVCSIDNSSSMLPSSKLPIGTSMSEDDILSDKLLQTSLSPDVKTLTKAVIASPTEVIITGVGTKISEAIPSSQVVKETSERQKLLQRRVVSIADYFAPLVKNIEVKKPTELGQETAANDSMLSSEEEPENKAVSPPEQRHNDETPIKNRNFLKRARETLGCLLKKNHGVPPCKYLDKYRQIAEVDLKPVIDRRVCKPICLGFGSGGAVGLMKLMQDGKQVLVAVKSFPYEDAFSRKKKNRINKKIANELKAMDRLRDIPEFPDVIGVCKNECGYHIVMEFIGNEKRGSSTNLNREFWHEYNNGYPLKSKKRDLKWLSVLLDTAKAINQMHARGVLHCDIAARNVLLYKNEKKDVAGKLVDLGFACDEDKPRWLSLGRFRTESATRRLLQNHDWCAPEFGNGTWWKRGGYHSKASDVWAFGQVLTDMSKLMTTSTASDLRGLIEDCTTVDPKDRASAKHIQSKLDAIISRIR